MSDRRRADAAELQALVRAGFEESARVGRATLETCGERLLACGALLVDTFRGGGRLLAFGNGGSAADAQHLAAELAGRYRDERPALPALALSANSSDLTSIGNDYGFDHVFSRLIEAHGRPGDAALAISTSGNSTNVCAAIERAGAAGLRTLALTGRGGGKLAGLVEVAVVVPSDVTARIQEAHATAIHVLCELVDATLFPDAGPR